MFEQPDARRLPDGRYILHEVFTYHRSAYFIAVPEGFIWDGASVPRWFWTLTGMRPDGPIRAAALLHDYLYRYRGRPPGTNGSFTRTEADVLLYEIAREAGCSWWTAWRAYRAVRWFGWWAWKTK